MHLSAELSNLDLQQSPNLAEAVALIQEKRTIVVLSQKRVHANWVAWNDRNYCHSSSYYLPRLRSGAGESENYLLSVQDEANWHGALYVCSGLWTWRRNDDCLNNDASTFPLVQSATGCSVPSFGNRINHYKWFWRFYPYVKKDQIFRCPSRQIVLNDAGNQDWNYSAEIFNGYALNLSITGSLNTWSARGVNVAWLKSRSRPVSKSQHLIRKRSECSPWSGEPELWNLNRLNTWSARRVNVAANGAFRNSWMGGTLAGLTLPSERISSQRRFSPEFSLMSHPTESRNRQPIPLQCVNPGHAPSSRIKRLISSPLRTQAEWISPTENVHAKFLTVDSFLSKYPTKAQYGNSSTPGNPTGRTDCNGIDYPKGMTWTIGPAPNWTQSWPLWGLE